MMTPAHVVLTEMLIDPMCSLAFEAAPPSAGVMKRPPRPASSGLLDKAYGWRSAGMGLLLLGLLMGLVAWAQLQQPHWAVEQQRALVMTGLLAGNLSLVALALARGGSGPIGPVRRRGCWAWPVRLRWACGS